MPDTVLKKVDEVIEAVVQGADMLAPLIEVATSAASRAEVAAAAAGGYFAFYPTKANATAALAGIPADAFVQVFVDESLGGAHAAYQKVGGALVLRLNFSKLLNQDVVTVGSNSAASKAAHDITTGNLAGNLGVRIRMKSGSRTGIRIEQEGTGEFMAFHEYRLHPVSGVWYDYGASHIISGAATESVKFLIVTGDVINSHVVPTAANGYDMSGVNDPNFRRYFIQGSARNNLGILAGQTVANAFNQANNWSSDFAMAALSPDGPTTLELTSSQYDTDEAGDPVAPGTGFESYSVSFRDRVLRTELGGINCFGDVCLGDGVGWNQPRAGSAEVNSRGRVDVKVGRKSKSVWGMKEGVFSLRHYDLADLTDELDSAEAEQGLLAWLRDAPAPGPHVTFGSRWIPFSLDSANAVYGSGFDWTVNVDKAGGPPTALHTEEAGRTFIKTAADEAWDIIIHSTETITGNQKISFKVKHISNNPLMIVGFMDAGAPAGSFEDEVTHGLLQLNGLLFRVFDSTLPFDTYHAGLVVGDKVTIRMEGGIVTSSVNGGAPLAIKAGAANVPYRVAVAFNHVGAAIENLRHVAL